MEPMLSRNRLAELLDVSLATLDRLRASEDFPQPIRVGRSVRWLPSDIESWLRRGRAAAPAGEGGRRLSAEELLS